MMLDVGSSAVLTLFARASCGTFSTVVLYAPPPPHPFFVARLLFKKSNNGPQDSHQHVMDSEMFKISKKHVEWSVGG